VTYYVLDSEHRPVLGSLEDWARWRAANGEGHVDYTVLSDGVTVSTVFLGIDHRFGAEGPPLLFETMIFGGPLAGYQQRYSTWDDALVGHDMALKLAQRASNV